MSISSAMLEDHFRSRPDDPGAAGYEAVMKPPNCDSVRAECEFPMIPFQARGAAELIFLEHELSTRVGAWNPVAEPALLARAEAALAKLLQEAGNWLPFEVAKLELHRAAAHSQGETAEAVHAIYRQAHEIEQLGSAYGESVVSDIAGSICNILAKCNEGEPAPLPLIDAHLQAIREAMRNGVRDNASVSGRALLGDLGRRVAGYPNCPNRFEQRSTCRKAA